MRSSMQYTGLRLLIFLACMVALWFIPWMREHGIVLLFTAATVSMLISVFALNGMRDRMSAEITEKIEARHQRQRQHRSLDDREDEDYEDEHPADENPADENPADENPAASPPSGERYR